MREQKINIADAMPLIREKLDLGHHVTFFPLGTSMLPFLKEGRDSVTLSRVTGSLKKYDVPLYKRANGHYVLHRIVRVGETYTCLGDNQFVLEKGIAPEQIVAVCVSFTRKGKVIPASALRLRLYAMLWYHSRFPRRVAYAVFRRIKRALKRAVNAR